MSAGSAKFRHDFPGKQACKFYNLLRGEDRRGHAGNDFVYDCVHPFPVGSGRGLKGRRSRYQIAPFLTCLWIGRG